MLYKELGNFNRQMFKDNEYILKINYNSFFLTESSIEKSEILFNSYKELRDKRERNICRLIESFIYYYHNQLSKSYYDENEITIKETMKCINKSIIKIPLKDKTLNSFMYRL